MPSTTLDDKFWKRFATQYWERKPVVLENIKSDLLELNDEAVFKLVVEAADQSRRDKKLLGFKFFVHGIRSSDTETMFVLPKKSDKSFLGYNERMERMYQDYCLVCDELLQVNRDKQSLLTQFTRQLYKQVGFPNQFAEMGLYLGNYRKTPFGVHRDECGVFSFPVVGVKKFRAWTSEYVAKNPKLEQSFRYAKYKADSQLLEANAGDMAYWPSSSWHIAESNGSFSATWSLGVWINRQTRETVGETLVGLLSEKIGSALSAATIDISERGAQSADNGEVTELPAVFDQAIAALQNMSREELEQTFKTTWMKRLASSGMKTLAKNNEPFHLGKTLKLRNLNSLILWKMESSAGSKNFKFSFLLGDGDVQTSASKTLLKLIKDLNTGESCELRNYDLGSRTSSEHKAIKNLGEAGAFAK